MTSSYLSYWGKAGPDDDYHLLAYHCLDAAAVASAWWSRSPAIRSTFGNAARLDEKQTKAWVLFFIGLHDLGKFDVRFQLKSPETARRLWAGFSNAKKAPYAHGENGYAWFVQEAQTEYGLSWKQAEACETWMRAVAGHHGNLPGDPEIQPPFAREDVKARDRTARREWIHRLWGLFLAPAGIASDSVPPPCPPYMAGFCSVCDWIGSNEAEGYFTYLSESSDDLLAYFESRRQIAENALEEIGLWRRVVSTGGMGNLFPQYKPHQIQTLVDLWPAEPGLTIVEAPTGSGKTEAALAYAARLLAENIADSIVFALPTQATANAMLGRIEAVAERLFPEGGNVVLAHGKSRYNQRFIDLQKAAEKRPAQGKEEALVQCAKWLSCSRKRVFLGQIGVCTIDQVLLSVLPVRHQFVRAFGVRKSVLIIDEVHAYDTYMYGLLNAVLKGQRAAGGSAILLSATLPGFQRERLLADWSTPAPLEADPYPLVTHADAAGRARTWSLPDEEKPSERHVGATLWRSPNMLPNQTHLKMVFEAAKSGAMVAIVCNLVADAQYIFERLKADFPGETVPVDLFHARFRFGDRQAREREILRVYGKNASRKSGRILVATQVIEQSLDLDFDWLITQLCPADLMFQRLGRLHRHPRENRPSGFETPRFAVLLPEDSNYGLHSVIYGNVRALWRTQQLLGAATDIRFPEAYREWVEGVYDEAPWPDEPEEITIESDNFLAEAEGRRYAALQRAHADAVPLNDTDGNAAMLTRDGETNLNVVPVILHNGNRLTLDGDEMVGPEDWRHAEQLNHQIVSVPNGWKKTLPAADENGLHYLPVRAIELARWEHTEAETLFRYTIEKGLEKLTP